jgi:hypothetical protein
MTGRHAGGVQNVRIAKRILPAVGVVLRCVLVLAFVLGVPALIIYAFVAVKWPLPGLWTVASLVAGVFVITVMVRTRGPSYRNSLVLMIFPVIALAQVIPSPSSYKWADFTLVCAAPLTWFLATRRQLRKRDL